jgi:putative transposase
LFRTGADYRQFLATVARTKQQYAAAIKLYGYCVMPNHWHFIICAQTTPTLSHFMRHLTRRHAISFIADHPERSGAIYQGRFRCVPIQDGGHLSTVLLYVDRNPLKAGFVDRAEEWLWSSVVGHAGLEDDALLDPLPTGTFDDWLSRVNTLDAADTLAESALRRNSPIGEPAWVGTLSGEWNVRRRPRGRPGKINREEI